MINVTFLVKRNVKMFALKKSLSISRLFCSAASAMMKYEVVYDVIDQPPQLVADVIYPSGAKVTLGNILTPFQVKDVPRVKWKAEQNGLYTMCLVDPDAPSREDPKFREWHHWLVGNVPQNFIEKGVVLSEYIGSAPPQGTGLHRYVFLVFKQNEKIKFDEKRLTNNSRANREGFSIRKFAKKYKLGSPIAGNLYHAQYDDYVPIIYRKLGV